MLGFLFLLVIGLVVKQLVKCITSMEIFSCTRVTNGCMFESFMFWFLHLIGSIIDFQKLVGSGGERQPSDAEVRAAVWETCGDSGALQLLVDLLQAK